MDGYEISDKSDLPPLRMTLHGQQAAFTLEGKKTPQVLYRNEARRGYESIGELWAPGYFRIDLMKDQGATLVASTESWDAVQALSPAGGARCGIGAAQSFGDAGAAGGAERALPASWFWPPTSSSSRQPAASRTPPARRAAGDEVRTVIAGYYWFTDWGRDTMISPGGADALHRPSP